MCCRKCNHKSTAQLNAWKSSETTGKVTSNNNLMSHFNVNTALKTLQINLANGEVDEAMALIHKRAGANRFKQIRFSHVRSEQADFNHFGNCPRSRPRWDRR